MAFLDNPWLRGLAEILLLLTAGVVVRWLIVRAIRRLVGQVGRQRDRPRRHRTIGVRAGWGGPRGEQRAAALGSLATSITTVVVGGVTVVGIFAVLGFDVYPLLASAGVVGVALGFGAQNLIKDLLAGVGMLLEDQLGVGDVVDMDKASGTVEAVWLRVTRLRDGAGVIWYVRNGEVLRVGNKSQGSAQIVLDVQVAYNTDLDRAEQVIGAVADSVSAEPAVAAVLIEPPVVVGVEQVTGAGVTIRVVGAAQPDQNGPVERELRVRIKHALDEAGISLAVPVPGPPAA